MSLSPSQFTELRTMLLTHAESEAAKHGSWKDDLSEYTFELFNMMKTFVEANAPDQDELVKTKMELAKTTFELEKTTIKLEKASGICFSKTEELKETKLVLEKLETECKSEHKSDTCPGCEKQEMNPYDDSHCSEDGSAHPKCLRWNPPASTPAVYRTCGTYEFEMGSEQRELNLESLTYDDTDDEDEDEDECVDGMRHGWSVDWPGLLGAEITSN